MKILVTGGAGYVGSVLVPELMKKGHQVRVLDNLIFRQTSLLPYFIEKNFEFIHGDIRDTEAVSKAVKGVDAIIHLAAIVGAPACKKNPQLAEEVNFTGTVNLNNARDLSQKFLFASTGSVYGEIKEICLESLTPNPLSLYGITKLKSEQEIMSKGNAVAYRFATAFGLSPRLRLDLLPNDFVFNALKNKYLVIYDKDFKRTFIHVRDMAASFVYAVENFDSLKNEVYNVGSEAMNKTKEEIARIIQTQIKFEVYFADKGIPDPDQRNYEVSYEKIRSKGFHTSVTFEQGVRELALGLHTMQITNPYANI